MSMFGFTSKAEPPPAEEDGESKAELLRRIQSLLEKNKRYEMRFRDTVQAYKSVLKEKEALESTIASINTPEATTQADGDEDRQTESSVEATPASGEQVASLTRAIAALNKEKKTLTERFQADKKATLEAHREELRKLKEELQMQKQKHGQDRAALVEEKELIQAQVVSLTQQLLARQQTIEDGDKALQELRQSHSEELKRRMEQLSASEKDGGKVRQIQKDLVLAQDKELALLARLDRVQMENQREVERLNADKEELRQRLAAEETKGESNTLLKYKTDLRHASSQIQQLQERLKQEEQTKLSVMKEAQQRMDLMQQNVASAEKRLEETRATHDRERMMFESRASESASLVGRYEDLRQEDLKAVEVLRKENHSLQDQLHALQSEQRSGGSHHPADVEQIAQLQEKVAKLKSLVMLNQKRAARGSSSSPGPATASMSSLEPPPWLVHMLNNDQDKMDVSGQDVTPDQLFTLQCFVRKQNLEKTVNEGARQQAIHARQQEQLQKQLEDLKGRHRQQLKEACDKWEAELEVAHKQVKAREVEFQEQLEDLQERQQRTRERTVALMADKDEEIARLRTSLPLSAQEMSFHDSEDTSQYLTLREPSLHLTTLQKEWTEERDTLRGQCRQLEVRIAELDEQHHDDRAELQDVKAELDRLNRNTKREGANLEYLKNVVLNYLEHPVGRTQKLRAIATILQFTPAETQRAVAANSKPWPFNG
eukprot:m.73200 g.73200  ORF g.73200 m.73200 type:complete len:716 (-) comp14315_c0_seq1:82-2229(-)